MSPQNIQIFPCGTLSAVIPADPEVTRRRNAILRQMAAEETEAWNQVRASLPHRSEVYPGSGAEQEREAQDRSLARGKRPPGFHLHPMGREVYLLHFAGQFIELAPRLNAMRAELTARPDEYGEDCLFHVGLFAQCGPAFDPELGGLHERAERSLAGLVCYVADPNRPGLAKSASAAVLPGLHLWSNRSRWAFSAWIRSPFFPS